MPVPRNRPAEFVVISERDALVDESEAYPKLVLSQSKNPALDPLTEFNYRELAAQK